MTPVDSPTTSSAPPGDPLLLTLPADRTLDDLAGMRCGTDVQIDFGG